CTGVFLQDSPRASIFLWGRATLIDGANFPGDPIAVCGYEPSRAAAGLRSSARGRMRLRATEWLAVVLGAACVWPACAAATNNPQGSGGGGGAGGGSASGGGGSISSAMGGGGPGSTTSSGTGGGGTPKVVYVHTNKTLFTIDPTSPTLTPSQVGDFD